MHDRGSAFVIEVMIRLALASTVLLLLTVGCSSSSDGPASDESNLADDNVSGDAAKRLLGAFDAAGGVSHASGGARGVRASNVLCLERSNFALGENDPLFAVPSIECSYAAEGYANPFAVKDEPAAATLLFDALAAVAPTAVGSEPGGRSHVEIVGLDCQGKNLGTGNEPSNAPAFTAACEVTLAGAASPLKLEGEPAQRIVRALHHGKKLEKASDGSVGSSLRAIGCEKNNHGPYGDDSTIQGIATTSCSLASHGEAMTLADPKPNARQLFVALEKAGVASSSASGGQTGVMTDSVVCFEGNGQAASCAVR